MGKTNRKTSLSTVAFFNILGPLILNGINFFTVPIFSRILGTANYGVFALYLTYVSIATIIISLQALGSIAPASLKYKSVKDQRKYLSSITFLSLCNFIFILAVSLVFLGPISSLIGMSKIVVVLILVTSLFGSCCTTAIAYFTFRKYTYKSFIISITNALINVSLSLILLHTMKDHNTLYMGRIIGNTLANVIIGFLLMVLIFIAGKTFYSKEYWKFCLALSLPLVFHGLSQVILSQSDRIMLKGITQSDSLVGVYSLVYSLASLLTTIYGALNNTWVPFYFDYVTNKDLSTIKTKSKNYIELYTILTMGFILLAPEIIKICGPKEFWNGINLTPILTAGMFMMFLYSFPVNFEFYNQKTINIAIGTVISAICNILLNLILIPKYNIYGAAWATLISYSLLFVFHQYICTNVIKNDYHYKYSMFLPYCIAILLCSVIFYLFLGDWIIRWGIGALLGIYLVYKVFKRRSIF